MFGFMTYHPKCAGVTRPIVGVCSQVLPVGTNCAPCLTFKANKKNTNVAVQTIANNFGSRLPHPPSYPLPLPECRQQRLRFGLPFLRDSWHHNVLKSCRSNSVVGDSWLSSIRPWHWRCLNLVLRERDVHMWVVGSQTPSPLLV